MRPIEQQAKLRKFFRVSLALHGAFFLLMLVGKFVGPSSSDLFQPSVQIDMVALPDVLKNADPQPLDPSLPVKDAPPPKPTPKEEPAKDEMTLPKEKEKKAEADAKKALERLRAERKKEEKADEKKREELVNKREQDLKRFEEAYRSALKGNQTNQGTNATGALQAAMNAYAGHVRDRLNSNWALPVWLQDKGLRAVVRLYIDERGNIIRYQFSSSSGNDAFDNYVKGTMQRSGPFAPPPEEMARGLRNSGLEVQFPL